MLRFTTYLVEGQQDSVPKPPVTTADEGQILRLWQNAFNSPEFPVQVSTRGDKHLFANIEQDPENRGFSAHNLQKTLSRFTRSPKHMRELGEIVDQLKQGNHQYAKLVISDYNNNLNFITVLYPPDQQISNFRWILVTSMRRQPNQFKFDKDYTKTTDLGNSVIFHRWFVGNPVMGVNLAEAIEEFPIPVDGRDIFLRDGERIVRAIAYRDVGTPQNVYISSISKLIQRGGHLFLKTFVLEPGNPAGRFYTTIPIYHLEPYPGDEALFSQLVSETVDKYSLIDFLLQEQGIMPVEKQTKSKKKHVKWATKEKARAEVMKQLAQASNADAT